MSNNQLSPIVNTLFQTPVGADVSALSVRVMMSAFHSQCVLSALGSLHDIPLYLLIFNLYELVYHLISSHKIGNVRTKLLHRRSGND